MVTTRKNQRILTALCLSGALSACGGGSSGSETSKANDLQTSSDDALTETESPSDLTVNFISTPEPNTHLRYASFQFNAEGAVEYQCSLNNNPFQSCQSPRFEASVDLDLNQLSVKAIDSAGESGEAETFSWFVEDVLIEGNEDLIITNVSPSPSEAQSWRGIFRINCDFSHSSYNDPIVFPDQANAAHLHRFYGNTLVDESTDTESLYTLGESTCQGNRLNMSAYWIPALLAPTYDQSTGERLQDANGEPAWQVVPAVVGNDDEAHEIFYYSAGVDDLQAIQPLPAGLRMIAGTNTTLPGEEQDSSIARWHCQSWESDDATNPQFSATIPECEEPDRVRMDIFFPSCWDGVNLDSADHRSHMAYPVTENSALGTHCPESHPVPVVRVSYHYAFGVKPEVTHPSDKLSRGWRLASDMYDVTEDQAGGLSLHGDWFGAWHPTVMEAILENCIQQQLDCHDGNLANGYRLSGTQEGTSAEPEIINKGLGDPAH